MTVRRRIGAIVAGALLAIGAVATAPGVAHAAPPDAWGFAYLDNPTPPAGWVMDPARQWGSWKAAFPADFATVDQIATGYYRVRFPHIASHGGIAHVTAVLWSGPAWCSLTKWYPSGADEYVEVQCYRHGGVPADTRFGVVFSAKSAPLAVPGGEYAYTAVDATGGLVDSYNSTFAGNASGYGGPGFYKVYLPGVGDAAGLAGNIQVTAVESGAPRRCKVFEAVPVGVDVLAYITCHDGVTSAPADSAFTLIYHRERSVFGEFAPPKRFGYVLSGMPAPPPGTDFNSAGAANTIISSGPGQYLIIFGQLGIRETHAAATAYGKSADYCSIQEVWRNIGGDGYVRNVICFDAAGAQAPNMAFVTFTSRV